MALALPVAFRTLFTCLFIFMFRFCAKINSSCSSSSYLPAVKVGGNAWKHRYLAHHFCILEFPGLKEFFFPWERTLPGRKDSSIHGNATSESEFGQDNGVTGTTVSRRNGYW